MIIGELLTGVRILLEKAPSGYNISEDQQLTENIPKLLFFQMTEPAKRGGRGGPPWAHPIGRRGPQSRRAATWGGSPGPPQPSPFRVLHRPETLRRGGSSRIVRAASSRRKTPERKELSGRQKSAGEIPSRRGEIVAIVTVIELDFIGIIIIIISTTDTVISTAAPRLRCNI